MVRHIYKGSTAQCEHHPALQYQNHLLPSALPMPSPNTKLWEETTRNGALWQGEGCGAVGAGRALSSSTERGLNSSKVPASGSSPGSACSAAPADCL